MARATVTRGGVTRNAFPRGPISAATKAAGQGAVYKADKASAFGKVSSINGKRVK